MYKRIKCSSFKCTNAVQESESFDFDTIAFRNDWQKVAGGYVCRECQEKQNSKRKTKAPSFFEKKADVDEQQD